MKDAGEDGERDGNKAGAHHEREEHRHNVVERTHLARTQTESLHHRLHTVADVHEQAADGNDVGRAAHRVLEATHNVLIAVGGVAVEGKLPEVEEEKRQDHHPGDHHRAGGKGGLQRAFFLVVRASIVILIFQNESQQHMHGKHRQQSKPNRPQQPCRHAVQSHRVVVDP